MYRKLVLAAAFVVVLGSVAILSPAEAARGGGGAGKGGGKGGRTTVTLVATPPVVDAGESVTLDAAGLAADSIYYVGINQTLEWYPVATDSQGKFTYLFPEPFDWPGTHSVCVAAGAAPLACATITVR